MPPLIPPQTGHRHCERLRTGGMPTRSLGMGTLSTSDGSQPLPARARDGALPHDTPGATHKLLLKS